MGKNLKGKGICQRKDGQYYARFVDRSGKRRDGYFATLPDARNWLEDARYQDKHGKPITSPDMTVDEWFEFWQAELLQGLSPNTKRNYRDRYVHNIKPVMGDMRLVDVKPMHCKIVLNRMEKKYAGSTIRQAYIAMGTMFKAAKMNHMIDAHPMDGVRYTKPVRAADDIHFLTIEEQERFLNAARSTHNFYQYALILETGLRTGEMIGLTWDAIDWKKRTLTVNKTLEYRHKQGHWRAGPPKTVSSYRTIPLTERAYDILKAVHATRAIERGMPPKTLQKLLGHASIKTTMDRYVHVTEESLVAGVRQFEQGDPANTQLEQTSAGDNTKKSDSAA